MQLNSLTASYLHLSSFIFCFSHNTFSILVTKRHIRSIFLLCNSSSTKNKTMKQKVVIKVSMHSQKCRSKALKIAVGLSGVDSAALKGEDKSQIELIGDGMDTVKLTTLLRKKVGYAEIVSVGAAEKKDDREKQKVEPLLCTYQGGVPCYSYQVVAADPHNNTCSIM